MEPFPLFLGSPFLDVSNTHRSINECALSFFRWAQSPKNLNFEHTCTNSHQEDATHSNEPVKTNSQQQSSEVAPKVNSSNGVVQSEMVDDPK